MLKLYLKKGRLSDLLRGPLFLSILYVIQGVSMQSNSSQQAVTDGAEWGYGPGEAVTWPWCEGRGQRDTACISRVFPRPKPYSLSHLWPPFYRFSRPTIRCVRHCHISRAEWNPSVSTGPYLSEDFFPLSPSISPLTPLYWTASQITAVSPLSCLSFRPVSDGLLPYCHIV